MKIAKAIPNYEKNNTLINDYRPTSVYSLLSQKSLKRLCNFAAKNQYKNQSLKLKIVNSCLSSICYFFRLYYKTIIITRYDHVQIKHLRL